MSKVFWFNRRQLLRAILRGGLEFYSNGDTHEWRYPIQKINQDLGREV